MLAFLLSVALVPAPQSAPPPEVSLDAYTGAELARRGGTPPLGGLLSLTAGQALVLELPASIEARSVGVWWQGELGAATLATGPGDGSFDALHSITEDGHLSPSWVGSQAFQAEQRISSLHHSYGGPAREARLVLRGPTSLASLSLVWIAPPQAPPARLASPQSASAGYPKPIVWSRASWGASDPVCGPSYCEVTHIGVHHSASSSGGEASSWEDCAENVRSIQAYHMFTKGWCDIGYNYLVCPTGDIFEGRGGGDDVKAAHDSFNCGSMGVCLMGYYHPPVNQAPSAAMLAGLQQLGAWKCDQKGIDPQGQAYYSGYGAHMASVYGHQDVKATACPGDHVYAQLNAIRAGIAAELEGADPGGEVGTLKGILFDATLGTSARIAGGTVALADGSFRVTGDGGYFEFSLPAGLHSIGATAPGFEARSSAETVSEGEVWESLGLTPTSLPIHSLSPAAGGLFELRLEGDPGSPAWLGFAPGPGLSPLASFTELGLLWPALEALQVISLGQVPASGSLLLSFPAPALAGYQLHTQGLVRWKGQLRLSNGAAYGSS